MILSSTNSHPTHWQVIFFSSSVKLIFRTAAPAHPSDQRKFECFLLRASAGRICL